MSGWRPCADFVQTQTRPDARAPKDLRGELGALATHGERERPEPLQPPGHASALKSNEETNWRKRVALLNQADRLLASHVVTLPLFARPGYLIHDSRLRGAMFNPTNTSQTWNAEQWSFAG